MAGTNSLYILNMALMGMGIYALIAKRHIIKKIIGVVIMEYAINLFLILIGYKTDGIAPIQDSSISAAQLAVRAVDPLPQAFVLTSIVIGLGTLALMASQAIKLYEKYKTFDMSEINRLRG
ncbi:NADH-quinone oxidoreductase subunit K [bacterium]|nr:NADH-quinone oxidoreductase subunit K [bacterium]